MCWLCPKVEQKTQAKNLLRAYPLKLLPGHVTRAQGKCMGCTSSDSIRTWTWALCYLTHVPFQSFLSSTSPAGLGFYIRSTCSWICKLLQTMWVNTGMFIPWKQPMISVLSTVTEHTDSNMEWNWVILFLLSVTAGKGLTNSKSEEETGPEVTMTSMLPFSPQASNHRSSCSSLELSWWGLGLQWRCPARLLATPSPATGCTG